jgi:hypothetical protein
MTTKGKIWLALGIGCGGFLIFCIVVAAAFVIMYVPMPSSEPTARDRAKVEHVTAAELVADYQANEVAADGRYKNSLAEITGAVERVGADLAGSQYVTLESGRGLSSVQCFAARQESFATLRPAQRVTVRGRVQGKSGNVLVKDCVVIRQ